MTDYSWLSGDERMYRPFYAAAVSQTLREIWQQTYGEEYADEAAPFGFSTKTDLIEVAKEMRAGPGDLFVDIGCGRGGPALWVARRTGAAVLGLDIVPEAVGYASRAMNSPGDIPASFRTASFDATKLPDEYADAIMSLDVFWMVHNKLAALREGSRILRKQGRLVMTTWVPDEPMFRSLLSADGFRILRLEPTLRWLELQLNVYREVLRRRADVVRELGDEPARVFLSEAEHAPVRLPSTPRMFVVAEKSGPAESEGSW